MSVEVASEHGCFGGVQGFYRMASPACGGPMRFAVFQPPQAREGRVPVLYYLAGLTCSEETATMKAGAQRIAAELGLMLVMPDTSPRDTGIDGATGDWEFGEAAGFYLDATQAPWSSRFRMETHVVHELSAVVAEHFPAD
ncbi:MAG: alpha/beta hydrolase-fold protein, partial [Pseudoxanthomonas sp.]|nr:alpha/beta hydrolase-fold protein [Pseudoxanthomonas sp.]